MPFSPLSTPPPWQLRDDFNDKLKEWRDYQKAVRDAKQKEYNEYKVCARARACTWGGVAISMWSMVVGVGMNVGIVVGMVVGIVVGMWACGHVLKPSPFHSISIPFLSTPLLCHFASLHSTPLHSTPLHSTPLRLTFVKEARHQAAYLHPHPHPHPNPNHNPGGEGG